ncbi:MAG TPA: hypothetical protein VM911_11095 [Pyrinomonadaceae bacterium]|nr:hypothetical protein [Pyrinomonadaceae bacterium]
MNQSIVALQAKPTLALNKTIGLAKTELFTSLFVASISATFRMEVVRVRYLCCSLAFFCGLLSSAIIFSPHNSTAALAQKFEPGCDVLPFEKIKLAHPIDQTCPVGGSDAGPSGNAPHRLQNEAKNNFCATGTPQAVTTDAFEHLQTIVNNMKDLKWGEAASLPPDRSVLKGLKVIDNGRSLTIGEGTKVSFVGFVLEAEHDDLETGEDVNCNKPGKENNDIHISLLDTPPPSSTPVPNSIRCQAITAEISPHYRPAVWDGFDSAKSLNALKNRPVRITGTLLFDAAHRPCENGTPSGKNPVRISVWEIHPVYAIDVCKNNKLSNCSISDNTAWTPYEQFAATVNQ